MPNTNPNTNARFLIGVGVLVVMALIIAITANLAHDDDQIIICKRNNILTRDCPLTK